MKKLTLLLVLFLSLFFYSCDSSDEISFEDTANSGDTADTSDTDNTADTPDTDDTANTPDTDDTTDTPDIDDTTDTPDMDDMAEEEGDCPEGVVRLKVTWSPVEGGNIVASPQGTADSNGDLVCYAKDSNVNLTVTSNSGYTWSDLGWEGRDKALVSGTYPDFSVVMSPTKGGGKEAKLEATFDAE